MKSTELTYKIHAMREKRKLLQCLIDTNIRGILRSLEMIQEHKLKGETVKEEQELRDIEEDCSAILGVLDEY